MNERFYLRNVKRWNVLKILHISADSLPFLTPSVPKSLSLLAWLKKLSTLQHTLPAPFLSMSFYLIKTKKEAMSWQRPIFPGRFQPSIFGTDELNFRVRNGYGWTLAVIFTNCISSFLRKVSTYPSLCQQRPIFPGRFQPSIFGTDELNFRVRNGYGWTLAVMVTDLLCLFRLSLSSCLLLDTSFQTHPFGAPSGIRTRDPLIKSQLLYQLS